MSANYCAKSLPMIFFMDRKKVIYTVVRKFAILVSFGILVVFMASDLQGNARVWYFL